jgi:cytochrome b6-f complex iron-sulfur subunit
MAETHKEVVKVWIAPGCIVCDACENDCPEVFDVQEQTCLIRPPAMAEAFLRPLTPSIIIASEGCPVDVIKFETVEVPGPEPWATQPAGGAAADAPQGSVAAAPAKAVAAKPQAPPDPRFQALLTTSKVSPSLSAGLASTIRKSPEVIAGQQMVQAVDLPKDAPPDMKMAMLAAGGAYLPRKSMGDVLRERFRKSAKATRREFNFALVIAWGAIGACTATGLAMFQDFFGPKVLKEPKKQWRVGKMADFGTPQQVDESYKKTPAGSEGFWLVNLQPNENKLIAISTICTHLGCIPNWLSGDQKFKCPCHGSGYYITGVNFEGPTPRPLERFAIYKDADGFVNVDQSKVYRSELGQWDAPESFIAL